MPCFITRCLLAASLMVSITAQAQAQKDGTIVDAFATLYESLCMQQLGKTEAMRARLLREHRDLELTADVAYHFLRGVQGQAWAVPYQGYARDFTLALPRGEDRCLFFVRNADPDAIEQRFTQLVRAAPPPLMAVKYSDEVRPQGPNGRSRVLGYTWILPNGVPHRTFMLTTLANLDGGDAPAQVFASATLLPELGSPKHPGSAAGQVLYRVHPAPPVPDAAELLDARTELHGMPM